MKPYIDEHGVPLCSLRDCPRYGEDVPVEDRCGGFGYGELCEPAVRDLVRERDRLLRERHGIVRSLGRALHYPAYPDDPRTFPDAVPGDVCVGGRTAGSLADEAADRIRMLEDLLNDRK